jgi:hypothetical protein
MEPTALVESAGPLYPYLASAVLAGLSLASVVNVLASRPGFQG